MFEDSVIEIFITYFSVRFTNQLTDFRAILYRYVPKDSSVRRHRLLRILINSVVLVRKRTIPTERPQPVGEVSANFS
jgi:hypothetical protein